MCKNTEIWEGSRHNSHRVFTREIGSNLILFVILRVSRSRNEYNKDSGMLMIQIRSEDVDFLCGVLFDSD